MEPGRGHREGGVGRDTARVGSKERAVEALAGSVWRTCPSHHLVQGKQPSRAGKPPRP